MYEELHINNQEMTHFFSFPKRSYNALYMNESINSSMKGFSYVWRIRIKRIWALILPQDFVNSDPDIAWT